MSGQSQKNQRRERTRAHSSLGRRFLCQSTPFLTALSLPCAEAQWRSNTAAGETRRRTLPMLSSTRRSDLLTMVMDLTCISKGHMAWTLFVGWHAPSFLTHGHYIHSRIYVGNHMVIELVRGNLNTSQLEHRQAPSAARAIPRTSTVHRIRGVALHHASWVLQRS